MARLVGPDEASREVKTIVGRAFQSKGGRPAQLWADAAATIPADVLTIDGAPVPGSTVTIDSSSMLPLVQFPPNNVDLIYGTCDGGPAWPIYARTDQRLDDLAVRVDRGTLVAAVPDDATDNRAYIQACLDQGGTWVLPATVTGRYVVNGALRITVPGTSLLCHGAPMRQGTDGMELIQVKAPDVTIDGLRAYGALSGLDFTNLAGKSNAWQMTIQASRWTAISAYTQADRLRIPWIYGSGWSSVVRVVNWDDATSTRLGTVVGCKIGIMVVDNCEFGIVVEGVQDFDLAKISGSYLKPPGGSRAAHLLYVSGTNDVNSGVTIGECLSINGSGGAPFQIKGVAGGSAGPMVAIGSTGALSLLDNTDLEVRSVTSVGDVSDGANAAASIYLSTSTGMVQQRVRVTGMTVGMATNMPAVVVDGSNSDCTLADLVVRTSHTTTSATADVQLGGTKNLLDGVTIINSAASNAWNGILVTGAGHVVRRPTMSGVLTGVKLNPSSAGLVIDGYDVAAITPHATAGIGRIMSDVAVAINGARSALGENKILVYDTFRISPVSGTSFGVTPSGHSWTALSGAWVSDTAAGLAYESGGAGQRSAVVDPGVVNCSIEAGIRAGRAEGLILRALDDLNWLCVNWDTVLGTLDVSKRDTGTFSSLATVSQTVTAGRRYHLRVQIYGAAVQVFLDGLNVLNHSLSAGDQTKYGAATRFGLRASGSANNRFDNFVIRSLT